MIYYPLVSIIIPMYNMENYIGDAIQSCIAQTYQNIEIIIIDDGSSDFSINIALKYKNKYSNITVLMQDNLGACSARNQGIRSSTGEYIKFLDADDILLESAVEDQVKFLAEIHAGEIGFGYSSSFDNNGNFSCHRQYQSQLNRTSLSNLILGNILTSLALYPRKSIVAVDGFNEKLRNKQEWDLNNRLMLAGCIFVFQDKHIYKQRFHDSIHRISNKKLDPLLDFNNLLNCSVPILACNDEKARETFSYVIWSIGRNLCIRKPFHAIKFYNLANSIFPVKKSFMYSSRYLNLLRIFGPIVCEWLRKIRTF